METVVKALYNASFTIWNTLMGLAMMLFSTSPTSAAGGSPYGTVHSLYNSISAVLNGCGQVLHHPICCSAFIIVRIRIRKNE